MGLNSTDFKDYVINFMLAGLFLFCILMFLVGLGNKYGNNDMTGQYFNTSALNQTLTEQSQTTNEWKTTFETDNPVIAIGGFVIFGIWAIIKNVITSTFTFITLLFSNLSLVLDIPPLILGVVTAVIIVSIIFAGWRVIRYGW